MPNYLIDTHCHLQAPDFYSPEQQIEFLQIATDNSVRQIICIGTSPEESAQARDFAAAHYNIFWTYGIHPEYANEYTDTQISAEHDQLITILEKQVQPVFSGTPENHPAPVAIGEIGLDYHYDGYDRATQIHLFEQMLQFAQDFQLPVSLHIREAFADAWPVLDNFPNLKGVVHSFTGSKKDLKQALARDFYIGVNGLVTYTTPPLPPLEKMLLETDAPFLTPVPFRGRINQPGYVRNVATYLAEKMGVAEVNIAEQTTKNARQLFQLGDPIIRPGASLQF